MKENSESTLLCTNTVYVVYQDAIGVDVSSVPDLRLKGCGLPYISSLKNGQQLFSHSLIGFKMHLLAIIIPSLPT